MPKRTDARWASMTLGQRVRHLRTTVDRPDQPGVRFRQETLAIAIGKSRLWVNKLEADKLSAAPRSSDLQNLAALFAGAFGGDTNAALAALYGAPGHRGPGEPEETADNADPSIEQQIRAVQQHGPRIFDLISRLTQQQTAVFSRAATKLTPEQLINALETALEDEEATAPSANPRETSSQPPSKPTYGPQFRSPDSP